MNSGEIQPSLVTLTCRFQCILAANVRSGQRESDGWQEHSRLFISSTFARCIQSTDLRNNLKVAQTNVSFLRPLHTGERFTHVINLQVIIFELLFLSFGLYTVKKRLFFSWGRSICLSICTANKKASTSHITPHDNGKLDDCVCHGRVLYDKEHDIMKAIRQRWLWMSNSDCCCIYAWFIDGQLYPSVLSLNPPDYFNILTHLKEEVLEPSNRKLRWMCLSTSWSVQPHRPSCHKIQTSESIANLCRWRCEQFWCKYFAFWDHFFVKPAACQGLTLPLLYVPVFILLKVYYVVLGKTFYAFFLCLKLNKQIPPLVFMTESTNQLEKNNTWRTPPPLEHQTIFWRSY